MKMQKARRARSDDVRVDMSRSRQGLIMRVARRVSQLSEGSRRIVHGKKDREVMCDNRTGHVEGVYRQQVYHKVHDESTK